MWVATQQLESQVAFLPVNPTLSALRNQARQKLATLDKSTFSQLVVDVLNECYSRQQKSMRSGEWWVGQRWAGQEQDESDGVAACFLPSISSSP